ncbi:MAG: hypothetical protein GY812_04305 [Actinomycetia bacterium]|nr:hypothetical protein [Actinomycetes bacterium]
MNDRIDPISSLDQPGLAVMAREYLLCGHLIDRAAMGYLIGPWGRDGMRDIAIDEWMGASPVYTNRMQRLLGFDGDDVATIFKGMQFDIGAPHEFLDFRFTVHDADHGDFRLEHCGALMDVEPMGEEFVLAMCHDIEDPTFDATACATNPRARMRPVHRPPRQPADRHPHCAWTVVIDHGAEPIAEAEVTALMRTTRAADVPIAEIVDDGSGALANYSGELIDPIRMEDFTAGALVAVIDEVCLQQHLLAMSFMQAVERRHGPEAAAEMGDHQLTGIAGITAERLRAALGLGTDSSSMATVFELHPALRPATYVDARVESGADEVTVSLHECAATSEDGHNSWIGLLVDGQQRPVEAIAHAVDPTAVVQRAEPLDGAVASWSVTAGDQQRGEHPEVGVTRLSTGAGFSFGAPSEVAVRLHR